MNRLLVIRFSALGDVAMTVPVVQAVAKANPQLNITILTRSRTAALFAWMPNNVTVAGIDLSQYKGITGLERLFHTLKDGHYDAVADLHDVLRSKYLRTRFRMEGAQVAVINKGRKDKKALIGHGLTHPTLTHNTQRYLQVFTQLGLPIAPLTPITTTNTPTSAVPTTNTSASAVPTTNTSASIVSAARFSLAAAPTSPLIGIAPFAAHKGKIYPTQLMQQVVNTLADSGNQILLFGSPGHEAQTLKTWERNNVTAVAGQLNSLADELQLMSKLNLMISMDSSNMHMAAIVGTQTISIWGATHPKAGFTAWDQDDDTILQIPMDCRPCSIYGNKPCTRGNYPCLTQITPQNIIDKARQYGAK